MLILLATALFLAAHMALYRILRGRGHLAEEAHALVYHAASFALVTVSIALASLLHLVDGGWEPWLAATALHGIYSMTFLEFWSVTEGSFFLSVLDRIYAAEGAAVDMAPLEDIGRRKRSGRLSALQSGGLLHRNGEHLRLSEKGRRMGRIFAGLRSTMGVREAG